MRRRAWSRMATTSLPLPRSLPMVAHLAWVAWNHPQMPWDGTELYEGSLDEFLHVEGVRLVAGGTSEAVQEPRYGADGSLFFISDRTGWWNLYLDAPDGARPLAPRARGIRLAGVGLRHLLLRPARRRQPCGHLVSRMAGPTSAPSRRTTADRDEVAATSPSIRSLSTAGERSSPSPGHRRCLRHRYHRPGSGDVRGHQRESTGS